MSKGIRKPRLKFNPGLALICLRTTGPRTAVSGGAAGTQLKDELRAMGRLEREALLKEALGKEFKITIPRGDILAMKADLGETWYKVRKLRR